jgi:hypothetical protein
VRMEHIGAIGTFSGYPWLAQTPCLWKSAFFQSGSISAEDIERHVSASRVLVSPKGAT